MDLNQEKQVVLAAQTDPEVFGVLFDEYHPKILAYLIRRTGEVALAQDLAAETFFKALHKLWQFRWRSISFSAWLYRIATNEMHMHFRSKATLSLEGLMEVSHFDVRDDTDLEVELKAAEAALALKEDFLRARAQLSLLPALYQDALTLRYLEEKEIPEIAEILGRREGTVRSLLSRGLQKLRTALQQSEAPRIVSVEASVLLPPSNL